MDVGRVFCALAFPLFASTCTCWYISHSQQKNKQTVLHVMKDFNWIVRPESDKRNWWMGSTVLANNIEKTSGSLGS